MARLPMHYSDPELVEISPGEALRLTQASPPDPRTGNTGLDSVEYFAAMIRSGDWDCGVRWGPITLHLTRHGMAVADGCHRVAAIAAAGVPVLAWVRVWRHLSPMTAPWPTCS